MMGLEFDVIGVLPRVVGRTIERKTNRTFQEVGIMAGRRPKRRHTAPQVRGYPISAAPPTIAVAALLGLARWCQQHPQQPGASPCAGTGPDQSPLVPEAAQPPPQRPAPLGPTLPRPAPRTRATRRTTS